MRWRMVCVFLHKRNTTMILNIIRADAKDAVIALQNWLFYRRMSFKMSLAIRLADMKQRAWNKQYHVMLLELPSGEKLVSINNLDIERLKRKKWLPKHTSMYDMRESIFYSTPQSRNNKSTPKERAAAKERYVRYARKFMKRS